MKIGKYKVERLDRFNIAILKENINKKTKEIYYTNLFYCGTWEGALLKLLNLNITSSEATEVLKEIKKAKIEIVNAIKNSKLR